MEYLSYQYTTNNNLISDELIYKLTHKYQAYISIFLYIYTYKYILLDIFKTSTHIYEYIIIFKLDLFNSRD
jgi:hypothetical protein